MASLIPGYEYDIFISYRQKDNRGERWVSEFVEALKIELESTFKEEVSVYFDVNPHDGLLETHEVNESLKEKLRCLVFIPIISRTYCDPKSFAWQNEFRAFVENASVDQFGLKVKLAHGNVASRVLPVRIHDLETEDVKLCESMTDGVLRGIEFIYKEPGVNRPLMPDDDEKVNLNKTKYRNQINKVANAIHEIIKSLSSDNKYTENQDIQQNKTEVNEKLTEWNSRITVFTTIAKLFKQKTVILLLLILLVALVFYFTLGPQINSSNEKSLVILPLKIAAGDSSLQPDADYFVEALTDKLVKISQLSLKPTISTLSYRDNNRSLETLGNDLNVNYVLYGNIRSEGDFLKIWIELSEIRKKNILWSGSIMWDPDKANSIVIDIVKTLSGILDIRLSQSEISIINQKPSESAEASHNYLSANTILRDAWSYINYGDRMLDSVSFSSAILSYTRALKEDTLFALAYAKRALAITWGYFNGQLDSTYLKQCRSDISKALSIDNSIPDTQTALGFYYYYCDIDYERALTHFKQAAEMDPLNYQPLYYQSLVFRKMGKWNESQDLLHQVIGLNPREALFLTNIGLSYTYIHKFDSAVIFHDKAIEMVPTWPAPYDNKIIALLSRDGNTTESRTVLEDAIQKTGDNMIEYKIILNIYDRKYEDALEITLRSDESDFKFHAMRFLYLARINYLMERNDISRKYCDSALVVIQKDIVNSPDSPELHGFSGVANAYLGNRDIAVSEGEKAVKMSIMDKMTESDMKINLAQIYTILRDYDNAASLLAYLLNNPSVLSYDLLKLDPLWIPLKSDPKSNSIISKK